MTRCVKLTFKYRVPVQDGATHEHHAVSRHSSWGGVVNVVHLKDDLTVGGHGDTVTVSQGQGLVVIKYRVQVLNPDGVYWAVENQPDMFTLDEKIGCMKSYKCTDLAFGHQSK